MNKPMSVNIEKVTHENIDEFENYINNSPYGHMFQSSKWATVKNPSKWEGFLCKDDKNNICGCISIMIVTQNNNETLLYIPRGPICDPTDETTITELLKQVKNSANKYSKPTIKIDSNVEYTNQTFIEIMKKNGFEILENKEEPTTIQCQYVYRINIKDKTLEDIFNDFHPNIRYAIRNAERKNVKVEICGIEKIFDFYHIMINTGEKDKFYVHNISYYMGILKEFKENARLYMAYQNGLPIGGAIAVHYGTYTWYLYAGTNPNYKKLSPLSIIQWNIIKWAKETNSEWYDLGGTGWINDTKDMFPGLSYSKEKMGATRYKLTPGIEHKIRNK